MSRVNRKKRSKRPATAIQGDERDRLLDNFERFITARPRAASDLEDKYGIKRRTLHRWVGEVRSWGSTLVFSTVVDGEAIYYATPTSRRRSK